LGIAENALRFVSDHQDTIARIEYALARERLLDRNLTDHDAVSAVGVLLDTYRTEHKGVLYERTSDDLRVEALRRQLRGTIESLRNPEREQGRGLVDPISARLPLDVAIKCLEFIQAMAAAYLSDRNSLSGYVDFLARLFPREGKRSSILMP
jgi:hypothetical protein